MTREAASAADIAGRLGIPLERPRDSRPHLRGRAEVTGKCPRGLGMGWEARISSTLSMPPRSPRGAGTRSGRLRWCRPPRDLCVAAGFVFAIAHMHVISKRVHDAASPAPDPRRPQRLRVSHSALEHGSPAYDTAARPRRIGCLDRYRHRPWPPGSSDGLHFQPSLRAAGQPGPKGPHPPARGSAEIDSLRERTGFLAKLAPQVIGAGGHPQRPLRARPSGA